VQYLKGVICADGPYNFTYCAGELSLPLEIEIEIDVSDMPTVVKMPYFYFVETVQFF
jgi:hypothetical protein